MADVKIPKEGSIPMLKPSNYQEWKDTVIAWFKLSHCHKIINGTTPKPSRTSQELAQEGVPEALAKEQADWEKLNESGQGLIEYFTAPKYCSIYKELKDTTANPITAKRIWDQALLKFGKPNVFNGLTLWEKLIAFKFDYDKPLSGQITEYRRLREQCKEAGIVITNYLFALTFLTHLPSQYKSTMISIMESKKPSATLDTTGLEDIFQTVMMHEDFLKGGKKNKLSSSNIASVRTPENKNGVNTTNHPEIGPKIAEILAVVIMAMVKRETKTKRTKRHLVLGITTKARRTIQGEERRNPRRNPRLQRIRVMAKQMRTSKIYF
jgi:hypothetical protein